MKAFIIFISLLFTVIVAPAQIRQTTVNNQKPKINQPAVTTQASTNNGAVTTKPELTVKNERNNYEALVSSGFTKMKITLPFSTQEKEYYVQKAGHFYVLNGDIIVGNDFPTTMSYSRSDNDMRGSKWPNATIPIVIDPSIYENNLGDYVHAAISNFNNQTELCLVPRTNEIDYIRVVYSNTIPGAGLSSVGRQGGEQPLFLAASNSSTVPKESKIGVVMHELMHASGFYHEQCRTDRDQYIKINEANVTAGLLNNFQMEAGVARGAYDYCSIMHYSQNAFSKDGSTTIDCIQNGMIVACPSCLGNRANFTASDINGVDKFYSEVSRFPCKTNFPDPRLKPQMQFANIYPSASMEAMAAFVRSANLAAKEPPVMESRFAKVGEGGNSIRVKFVGAYPNFHEVRQGNNIVGGTIFLKSTEADWQDVSLNDLGNPDINDFAARMRATQNYAVRNGYVGGFPNFFHKDYGKGIVCGTVLISAGGADWRDVPLAELGNPPLDDIKSRFTSANDYAFKNGYLGGFPTFYQADYGKGIVCGIILIKKDAGKWKDVVIIEGPK